MTQGTDESAVEEDLEEMAFILRGRLRPYLQRVEEVYESREDHMEPGVHSLGDGLYVDVPLRPSKLRLLGAPFYVFVYTRQLNITNLLGDERESVEARVARLCGDDGWKLNEDFRVLTLPGAGREHRQILTLWPESAWQQWLHTESEWITLTLRRSTVKNLLVGTFSKEDVSEVVRAYRAFKKTI